MASPIFALILASLAFALAAMAAWNSYRIHRLLRSHSVRSVLELSAQQAAQASALESLSITVKRLSSRYGMAAKRGEKGQAAAAPEEPLSGPEWKAMMRKKLIRPGVPVAHGE